jgi:hypothetical protein
MITIFEGARNSGKSYLANESSIYNEIPLYKFDFTFWFNTLNLQDKSNETHLFALGKEIDILQANRDGIIKPIILDRGFLSVFVWGVLSERITPDEAIFQLDSLALSGLLKNCKVLYIYGDNPNKSERNKDNWDFRETTNKERNLYDFFISHMERSFPQIENFSIQKFENKFNHESIIKKI